MSRAEPPHESRPAPRGCTCFKVRRLARTVSRLYDQHMAEVGLKTTQYSLLKTVALGAAPLARLARDLGLERTTLSRNLKPLTEAGLITVERGADARSRVVSVTARGSETLLRARSTWRRAQVELQDTLGAASVDDLHRVIDAALAQLQPLLPGE